MEHTKRGARGGWRWPRSRAGALVALCIALPACSLLRELPLSHAPKRYVRAAPDGVNYLRMSAADGAFAQRLVLRGARDYCADRAAQPRVIEQSVVYTGRPGEAPQDAAQPPASPRRSFDDAYRFPSGFVLFRIGGPAQEENYRAEASFVCE
jgi:hypothetical protein